MAQTLRGIAPVAQPIPCEGARVARETSMGSASHVFPHLYTPLRPLNAPSPWKLLTQEAAQ